MQIKSIILYMSMCLIVPYTKGFSVDLLANLMPLAIPLNQNFCKLGQHIIVEFLDCENLDNYQELEKTLRLSAKQAGSRVLNVNTYKFEPQGMTGIALLQESHISVHTWPEHSYAAIDIFTCGSHVDIDKALEILASFFSPKKISMVKLDRGFNIQSTNS